MKKLFTEEDILRFLYNEMSIRESEAFLDVLYSDEKLWATFESYQQAVDTLPSLDLEPSQQSLDAVLSFVEDTQPTTTSTANPDSTSFPLLSPPARSHQLVMMAIILLITSLVITSSLFLVSITDTPTEVQPMGQHMIEEEMPPVPDWEGQELNEEIERIKERIEELKVPTE